MIIPRRSMDNSVNKVFLIGSVSEDHARRKGHSIAVFTVCTDRQQHKEHDEWVVIPERHRVQFLHCQDELFSELKAGTWVYIEGRLTYFQAPAGQRIAEVTASTVQLIRLVK